MFDHRSWTARFIREPGYNDAHHLGVTIHALSTPSRWRILGVHHLTGDENRGNHHIFCEVIDEKGARIKGVKLEMEQQGQAPVYAIVDKPANEPGGNFPLWGAMPARVSMAAGGDSAAGLRIDHISDGPGNSLGHNSFYIVFQRVAETPPPEPPGPPPTERPKAVARLDRLQVTVNQAWLASLRPDADGNVTFAAEVVG